MAEDYMQKRMREEADKHSGMQRRKGMTQEQKSREAIDYFTGEFKEHAEKNGKEMTGDQARKLAVDLANNAERKQGR